MKVFVIDLDRCNGCYGCQIACKDEHVGNEWPPYALPQPNTGQFWMRVSEKDHGQVPKVWVEYTPVPCQHCDDAPCVAAFPEAVYKRDDGLVIVDPVKARGCRELVEVCPYDAIFFNETLDVPQKCTGCAHLVDEGKTPHCVDLCATGGLRFGEEEEFAEEIAQAETLLSEKGTRPRVHYLNRPHLFLAGDVYDPVEDEIIEGARITLVKPDGSSDVTETDDFGDFYFRRIDPGLYSIRIEADGYETVERPGIELEESLNLGGFEMIRSL